MNLTPLLDALNEQYPPLEGNPPHKVVLQANQNYSDLWVKVWVAKQTHLVIDFEIPNFGPLLPEQCLSNILTGVEKVLHNFGITILSELEQAPISYIKEKDSEPLNKN